MEIGASAGTCVGICPEGNVISGNQLSGVLFVAGPQSTPLGNTVNGNIIGIGFDATGQVKLGNGHHGVHINQTGFANIEFNVISGNGPDTNQVAAGTATDLGDGVRIEGELADSNDVNNNRLGTDFTGTAALGNRGAGVRVMGAKFTEIESNLISGNGKSGVELTTRSLRTVLSDNIIGLNQNKDEKLANAGDGILIADGSVETIIGKTAGQNALKPNVIGGNNGAGIRVTGSNTDENVIARNFVGVNDFEGPDIGNDKEGIVIENSARRNRIDGFEPSDPNDRKPGGRDIYRSKRESRDSHYRSQRHHGQSRTDRK